MAGTAGRPGREAVPAAAVLAGGLGRRMGREKATLPVGGIPLAERVALAAAAVADPVVLVAPAGHAAASLGREVVADPGEGPLAAIAAALAALRAEHVLVLAGDHPSLSPGLLAALLDRRDGVDAVACRHAGRLQPLVVLYRRGPALAAAERLLAAGERAAGALLGALAVRVLGEAEARGADPGGRSFTDLDHPADLLAWEAPAGGHAAPRRSGEARGEPPDSRTTRGEAGPGVRMGGSGASAASPPINQEPPEGQRTRNCGI